MNSPRPELHRQALMSAYTIAGSFVETLVGFDENHWLRNNWLVLPVLTSMHPIEVVTSIHLPQAQLVERQREIDELAEAAVFCPMIKLTIQACPDCLADRSCPGMTFLTDQRRMTKGGFLKQAVETVLGDIKHGEDVMTYYGQGRSHLLHTVVHPERLPEDPDKALEQIRSLLAFEFVNFECRVEWCPSCNNSHREKGFAA